MKPFEKKPAPISYAEEPRLLRSLEALPYNERVRLWEGYRAHLETPRYASIQRRGSQICLSILGSGEPEVFDFGQETHAQRCLSAFTDSLRVRRAAIKVLMPE